MTEPRIEHSQAFWLEEAMGHLPIKVKELFQSEVHGYSRRRTERAIMNALTGFADAYAELQKDKSDV